MIEPIYLRYVHDSLSKGSLNAENAAALPRGFIGLYEQEFAQKTPVSERKKVLNQLALWALFKGSVSANLAAAVLEIDEEQIKNLINRYSSWFNSPESGKYQLYHERLMVYLLQRVSRSEISKLQESLIKLLEYEIEKNNFNELFIYSLQFLSDHYYEESFFNENDNRLFTLTKRNDFWQMQHNVSFNYKWTQKMLSYSIDLANFRKHNSTARDKVLFEEQLIELADFQGIARVEELQGHKKLLSLFLKGEIDAALNSLSEWRKAVNELYFNCGIAFSSGEFSVLCYFYLIYQIDESDLLDTHHKKTILSRLLEDFDNEMPQNPNYYLVYEENMIDHYSSSSQIFPSINYILKKYLCDFSLILNRISKDFLVEDLDELKIKESNLKADLMSKAQLKKRIIYAERFRDDSDLRDEVDGAHDELTILFHDCISRGYANENIDVVDLVLDYFVFKSTRIEYALRSVLNFKNSNTLDFKIEALDRLLTTERFEIIDEYKFTSYLTSCVQYLFEISKDLSLGLLCVKNWYGKIDTVLTDIDENLANQIKYFANPSGVEKAYEIIQAYAQISFVLYNTCYKAYIDELIETGNRKEAVELLVQEIENSSATWLSPSEDILVKHLFSVFNLNTVQLVYEKETPNYMFFRTRFAVLVKVKDWGELEVDEETGEVTDWNEDFIHWIKIMNEFDNDYLEDDFNHPDMLNYFFELIHRCVICDHSFDIQWAVDSILCKVDATELVSDQLVLLYIKLKKWKDVMKLYDQKNEEFSNVFFSMPKSSKELFSVCRNQKELKNWLNTFNEEDYAKFLYKNNHVNPIINECHLCIEQKGIKTAIKKITTLSTEQEKEDWIKSIEIKMDFMNFTSSELAELIPLFAKYGISSDRVLQIEMTKRFIDSNGEKDEAFIKKYHLNWLQNAFKQIAFQEKDKYDRYILTIRSILNDDILDIDLKLEWIDDSVFKLSIYGLLLSKGYEYYSEFGVELDSFEEVEEEGKFIKDAFILVLNYHQFNKPVVEELKTMVSNVLSLFGSEYVAENTLELYNKQEKWSFALYYMAICYYYIGENDLSQYLFVITWDASTLLETEDAELWCNEILDMWELLMGVDTLRRHFSKKKIAELPEWLIDVVLDKFKKR